MEDMRYRVLLMLDSAGNQPNIQRAIDVAGGGLYCPNGWAKMPDPDGQAIIAPGTENQIIYQYVSMFSEMDEAFSFAQKAMNDLPDGWIALVLEGETGPGITFQEMEEEEMDVEEALDLSEWDALFLIGAIKKEGV
jgi:hypothetical protein